MLISATESKDPSTILLTLLYEGLLIGFWFIDHAYVFAVLCNMSSQLS